jgi:adenylate cyclase
MLAALYFVTPWRTADKRVYDLFLHLRRAPVEDSHILLLNIDDQAISQVGIWPWSRDVVADGLVLLREFGAACTVFDIEYVDRSPQGVDSRYLEETLPSLFGERFTGIKNDSTGLVSALANRTIPLKAAGEYSSALSDRVDQAERDLLGAVSRIARDNDAYLGTAARLNGSAFFTVNMLPAKIELYHVGDELKSYVDANIPVAIRNETPRGKTPFMVAPAIQPTIYPILQGARGAGFPNVEVDEDGVRRRINLFVEHDGKYFAQLAFRPLLAYLGEPAVALSGRTVTLKGATFPDGTRRDIRIPVSGSGKILINWPHRKFGESFRTLSYKNLVVHDIVLRNLAKNLAVMEDAGYFSSYGKSPTPLAYLKEADAIKADILSGNRDPSAMNEFASLRKKFMEETGRFLEGNAERDILAQIDAALANPNLDNVSAVTYRDIRDEVSDTFAAVRGDFKSLTETRQRLAESIPGSFVIIGLTGISTFDTGVNPFEKNYMNVGTHAAVANTILTGDFLTEVPDWASLIAAILLAFLATVIVSRMDPRWGITAGAVLIVAAGTASALAFILAGTFVPIVSPLVSLATTTLAVSITKFILSEGEKRFLRNAFSRYLSADVISQLMQNPDLLNLGGEKKDLTVLFTDIKGFSTISEKLDPVRLVALLNEYLTAMSDIILEERGTIDKYEGDAIMCFFGAPVEVSEHAYRACLSAVRMRRAEKALNERLLADGTLETPIMTRIGINSGEMVVGNMGTPKKMDYTVMGNAVNLASRLEGVNKQYGTWICASESAIVSAGDSFVARKLDRVRVVGIDTPVRIYEVVEERSRVDAATMDGLKAFHEALGLFEAKQWAEAEKKFAEVLSALPGDGPATTFIGRCKDYRTKPPPESWDGVFSLVSK